MHRMCSDQQVNEHRPEKNHLFDWMLRHARPGTDVDVSMVQVVHTPVQRGPVNQAMDQVESLVAEALRAASNRTVAEDASDGLVQRQVYLRDRWREVPYSIDTKLNALRPHIGNELTAAVNS